MSAISAVNPGGKTSSPAPPSLPKNGLGGPPGKGDLLQVTAKGGLTVYDNVYTGQPGSSYMMGDVQALKRGQVATATGQTAKDSQGNFYDQVTLSNGKTGWIEAWRSSSGGWRSTLNDLPGPQSLLTQKDINGNPRMTASSAQQSAIADLRQHANDPAYLRAFIRGLGPRGMADLLGLTARTYDATKLSVSATTQMSNPYEVVANALRQSGLPLDQWGRNILHEAKNPPPILSSEMNQLSLLSVHGARANAVTGTRTLFNQMVLDQAYAIRSGVTNTSSNYSERCAGFIYNALSQAEIRPNILNAINGGVNGRNDAANQYAAAHQRGWLGSGGMASLTPGAIVFDPYDSSYGHVAIYAGLGADRNPVYLTTTGWSGTDGKIHLWSIDQINPNGDFYPKERGGWLDLTAGQ